MAITLRTVIYSENPGIDFVDPFFKNLPLTNSEVDQNFIDLFNLIKTRVAKEGDTVSGKLTLTGISNGVAPLNIPTGMTPAILSDGDIWTEDTLGIFYRKNSLTHSIVVESPLSEPINTYYIDTFSSGKLNTPRTISLSDHVQGSVLFDGSGNVDIVVDVLKASVINEIDSSAPHYIGFFTGTNVDSTFKASNNLIYIPSTNTLTATDFNSTSDISLKTNLNKINNGLDVVLQLQGWEYDFKSSGKHGSGVIAQDIEKVLPHVVTDNDGIKNVAYSQIIAYLIEAIKEQQTQIEELKNRL